LIKFTDKKLKNKKGGEEAACDNLPHAPGLNSFHSGGDAQNNRVYLIVPRFLHKSQDARRMKVVQARNQN